jgi:hypothetical protein
MPLTISLAVRAKLADPTHNVTEEEIVQCFANRSAGVCIDARPHHTNRDPSLPTLWFVSETDYGRRLKIVYVHDLSTKNIEIKSAYLANDEVARIYAKYAR